MTAQEKKAPRGQQTGGAARQARPAGLTVRPLEERDLAEAAAIEASAPDAWSESALRGSLQAQREGGAARLFAAEWRRAEAGTPGGETTPAAPALAGVAAFQCAAGAASLDTLTVAPAFRRQGVARALLQAALQSLCAEGAVFCFLEVRESNAPAIALYKSLGFTAVGRRRGFYQNPSEDALVMRCVLPL